MAWTIFLFFIAALALYIPIGYSLALASVAIIFLTGVVPPQYLASSFFSSGDNFPLMALPFFILAGDIMMHGGISSRLVNFGRALLSSQKGALGLITVFVCMIFAAISGSGPATAAAIGGIMIPAMKRAGYDGAYAASLTAASGSLGPIIPPSILLVLYGVLASVSITDLFLAGFFPGVLVGLCLMVYVAISCRRHKFGLETTPFSMTEVWRAFKDAIWGLLMPVIILGGIYTGVFTATEAAVVACDYGLIVSIFIYKELKIKELPKILVKSTLTIGAVMVLAGAAGVFARLLAIQKIPMMAAQAIMAVTDERIVVLLLINVLLLLTGMVIETISAVLIMSPMLLPIIKAYGVDPLHFGLIICVNLAIGQCTPPVGVNTFVAAGIAKIPFESTVRWLIPIVGSMIIALLIITYIPSVSLFLPNLFK
jgi:C4-dicarboxylate transporter DctM subunit